MKANPWHGPLIGPKRRAKIPSRWAWVAVTPRGYIFHVSFERGDALSGADQAAKWESIRTGQQHFVYRVRLMVGEGAGDGRVKR